MAADSMSSLTIAVEERRGCLGRIREQEEFSGHEMRGPVGTGRGGVSMAGGRQGQGVGKGQRVRDRRLPSPPYLFLEFTCAF